MDKVTRLDVLLYEYKGQKYNMKTLSEKARKKFAEEMFFDEAFIEAVESGELKPTPTKSTTPEIVKFEVGKTYITDSNLKTPIKVISRTEKMITIDYHGQKKRVKVTVYNGVEEVSPSGKYSMSPVLKASKPAPIEVEETPEDTEEKRVFHVGDIVGTLDNDNYYTLEEMTGGAFPKATIKLILLNIAGNFVPASKSSVNTEISISDLRWLSKKEQGEIRSDFSIKGGKPTPQPTTEQKTSKEEPPEDTEVKKEGDKFPLKATLNFPKRHEAEKFAADWGRYSKTGHVVGAGMTDVDVDIEVISEDDKTWVDNYTSRLNEAAKITPPPTTVVKVSLSPNDYKNHFELNQAIEKLVDSKTEFSSDEKAFLGFYSGYGGLVKQAGDKAADLTHSQMFYEFFTPNEVVKKMWGLAYKYGYNNGSVLEPSCGVGEFLKYAPKDVMVQGYEISNYSAKICRILFPDAEIIEQPFETKFIKRKLSIRDKVDMTDKFDLVIGNPPYGDITGGGGGRYFAMGEDKYSRATNYIDYFLLRSLDSCIKGGLVVMVIGAEVRGGGSLWLDKGNNPTKELIQERGELLDAYRLPNSIFERTGVISDIVVFKRK